MNFFLFQMVIWFIIPATRSPQTDHKNNALALIVLLQYVPRLYLIFPLSSQIIKATGVVTKTAWAGAAYNLLLYMLASHVWSFDWFDDSIFKFFLSLSLSLSLTHTHTHTATPHLNSLKIESYWLKSSFLLYEINSICFHFCCCRF